MGAGRALFAFAGTHTHQLGSWATGKVRVGPAGITYWLPERKYKKWEGSRESGWLKAVCGRQSIFVRGGRDFAKLGNERNKKTKQLL